MSEVLNPTMPAMSEFVPLEVNYTTRKGTEVRQERVYAVDENGKRRQVKKAIITNMFANITAMPVQSESTAPVATDEMLLSDRQDTTDARDDELYRDIDLSDLSDYRDDYPSADDFVYKTAIAAKDADITPITTHEKRSFLDRIKTKTFARAAGYIALVAAMTTSGFAGTPDANSESQNNAPGISAKAFDLEGNSVLASHNAEHKAQEEKEAAEKKAAEEAAKAAEIEKSHHERVINHAFAETTLRPDQVTEITNFDAVLPGEREAGIRSLNRGRGWDKYEDTVNGAKQMGADLLSGTGHYSAVDSQIAREALASKGMTEEAINKLAANDFADLGIKAYTINTSTANYHNIAYHNVLDKLAFDSNRAVGANDAFMIISFKDASGAVKAVKVRIDCSGTSQVFDTITVPETPAPAPAPEKIVQEEKKEEKKEEEITTRTTLPPTTVTTAPPPRPTTTTTAPPPPRPTTTTTLVVPPKNDDGDLPGNPNVPADQDKGTPDKAGEGPAGQVPDADGYLPGEDKPATPDRKPAPVAPIKPRDPEPVAPNPPQPVAPAKPAEPTPVAPKPDEQPTEPN